jgi:ferritin-like metal-binding protein YciE
MDDLFLHQLQDVYYAENQITKALPKMEAKATDQGLKTAFRDHLQETEAQITRLDQIFGSLGHSAKGVDCPTIDGLIEEANEVSGEVGDKAVLDVALIAAAQAVEHYEIARYGTLVAWAKQMGRPEISSLLEQTLAEEKSTDQRLTDLAENRLNAKAPRP